MVLHADDRRGLAPVLQMLHQAPLHLSLCRTAAPGQPLTFLLYRRCVAGGYAVFAYPQHVGDFGLVLLERHHDDAVARAFLAEFSRRVSFRKFCSYCGQRTRCRRCPCSLSRYCGAACQGAHWREHKRLCPATAGRRVGP
jgi:hypothetical protein